MCVSAVFQLKVNTYIAQAPPAQIYNQQAPAGYPPEYNGPIPAGPNSFAPIAPGPGGLASAISNGLAANGFNENYSNMGQFQLLNYI